MVFRHVQEELASEVVAEQDALAAAVESAEADTKAAKKTLDQLKDQYRRLQADFDNFRSRAEAEKTQTGKNVKMSVVQDLLPLVDNFELAASQVHSFPSPFAHIWQRCNVQRTPLQCSTHTIVA
jgi:molecular chaperone GrpE